MKRAVLTAAVVAAIGLSFPARAGDLPKTMLVDTNVIAQVQSYLTRRPYAEVAVLIGAMEGCLRLQVPAEGVTRATGECPEVSEAIRQRDEALAAEKRRADEAEARLGAGPATNESSNQPRP